LQIKNYDIWEFSWERTGIQFGNGTWMGVEIHTAGNRNGNGNSFTGVDGNGNKKAFPADLYSHKRRTLGCKMAWRAYDVTDDILQNVVVLGAVAVGPRSRTSRTLQHHLVEVLRQHLRSSGGSSRPASQRVVVEERHASLHAIVQPSLSSRTLLTLYSAKAIIVPHRIIWHWYTGRWWVGCYIWYSEEGIGRGRSPPRPLLAVPNVTAHSSVALRF